MTLKCCCGPSVRDLELGTASGEFWDKAGGETEQGMGTRVGGLEETFLALAPFFSRDSPVSGLSAFAVPVLGIKT